MKKRENSWISLKKNITSEVHQHLKNAKSELLFENFRLCGFEYLKKYPEDTKSRFNVHYPKDEFLLKFKGMIEQEIKNYVKKLVAFRLYYTLTGLYFDTNFEAQIYEGVGDGIFEEGFQFELIERKFNRGTKARGIIYRRSKNINAKSLEGKRGFLLDLKKRLQNMEN